MIAEAGAESCYVDYAPSVRPRPVRPLHLHGASTTPCCTDCPHDYALADGDLLTLDLAVSLDGIAADSAISFVVGRAARRRASP